MPFVRVIFQLTLQNIALHLQTNDSDQPGFYRLSLAQTLCNHFLLQGFKLHIFRTNSVRRPAVSYAQNFLTRLSLYQWVACSIVGGTHIHIFVFCTRLRKKKYLSFRYIYRIFCYYSVCEQRIKVCLSFGSQFGKERKDENVEILNAVYTGRTIKFLHRAKDPFGKEAISQGK